jgi:hypothetical protein
MIHNESGFIRDIPDNEHGISCLVISRLIDLQPIGLDISNALFFAALGFKKHPQIAEMIGNAIPLPTGSFDRHNTWLPRDFEGKVPDGLASSATVIGLRVMA